jgi:hypothetical protein
VICCIEAIFSPWQLSQPLLGPVPGETTKVHHNDLVGRLRLGVALWVEHGAGVQLGVG